MLKTLKPSGRFTRMCMTMLVLTITVSSLLSCAQRQDVKLPALNEESPGVYKPGKFVWFELITHDPEKVGTFYGGLFGWNFTPFSENDKYLTIEHEGRQIGGIVAISDTSMGSRWLSSLSVPDVDEAANQVRKLGGSVLYGPIDYDDRGRFAQVGDSQGADFVILRARQGDPKRSDPAPGGIVWVELFTKSVEDSARFYKGLISYEVLPADESDDHHYFAVGEKIRGGVTEIDYQDVKPTWLPFVGVDNLREVVLQAINSGGTLLAHTDTAAIILDPGGAAIGLQLIPSGGVQ